VNGYIRANEGVDDPTPICRPRRAAPTKSGWRRTSPGSAGGRSSTGPNSTPWSPATRSAPSPTPRPGRDDRRLAAA